MTNTWADYSSGRPGGAALKAAGITGVIRYVGVGSAGKRINSAEYADLIANGVEVLLVVELGIHDAEGGYSIGVRNATDALNDARGMGVPDSVGIAAACDEHLTAGQITTALAYVQGFRDVLGATRTGAYGFAEFVDAVHAAGMAGWWWKCGTAPTLSESQWVTFWQRNTGQTTQTINKVVVDLNNQISSIGIGDDLTPEEHNWLQAVFGSLYVTASTPYGNTLFDSARLQGEQLAALAAAPAPSVTLSADQLTTLEAAVSTAVAGLNLSVSASDVSAIAQAVSALLGAKLVA